MVHLCRKNTAEDRCRKTSLGKGDRITYQARTGTLSFLRDGDRIMFCEGNGRAEDKRLIATGMSRDDFLLVAGVLANIEGLSVTDTEILGGGGPWEVVVACLG
jgi:hypothetical protein